MNFWPFRRRRDDLIDSQIKPPVVKFTGHDEALEQKARARRQHADQVRRDARQIDTRDDRASKLYRVRG